MQRTHTLHSSRSDISLEFQPLKLLLVLGQPDQPRRAAALERGVAHLARLAANHESPARRAALLQVPKKLPYILLRDPCVAFFPDLRSSKQV